MVWAFLIGWGKKIIRRVFHNMWKSCEIEISMSINKTVLDHSHFHLHIVYSCCVLRWQSWVVKTEPWEPQSIKFSYLAIYREKLCCSLFQLVRKLSCDKAVRDTWTGATNVQVDDFPELLMPKWDTLSKNNTNQTKELCVQPQNSCSKYN